MAFRPLVTRLAGSELFCRGIGRSQAVKIHSQTAPESRMMAKSAPRNVFYILAGVGAIGVAWTLRKRARRERGGEGGLDRLLPVARAGGEKTEEEKPKKVSARELRYKSFASYVYKGEPYMSSRDFLDSLIRDEPRSVDKEIIDDKIVDKILWGTPGRGKGSDHLFKDMWNNGILSYGDYLFLLTALIKTRRQFEIAFKMYDVDGSDFIDLQEFSRVEKSVTTQRDNAIIEQRKLRRSSLSVHLFGYKGNKRLYSGDFFKFLEDLQTEVRHMEFDKYCGCSPAMSEEDFARSLLRHTTWDLEPVFKRLRSRPPSRGIAFQDYSDFCQLLNSLEDFSIAMTMYTIAGQPVSEDEFARAAHICLGKPLDPNLVSTVFEIFDKDGDHKLSYREFIAVMKGWKLRGYKMREKKQLGGPMEEFKACVRMEMRDK